MLTPLELENKRIITSKRRYDRFEMDEYLDMVFENYKALYNEYEEQKKQIKTLTEGIQYYRSIESTMQKALLLAEKTSKETKDAAVLKAEAIEKDANNRANQIIGEAENEYNRIREKCLQLVKQFNNYKAQLQVAAKEQLRLVTSATFEVDTPPIDGVSDGYDAPAPEPERIQPEDYEAYSAQPDEQPSIQPDIMQPEIQPEIPMPTHNTVYSGYEAASPEMTTAFDSYEAPMSESAPVSESIKAPTDASAGFEMYNEPVADKTMVLPDVKSVDRAALRGGSTMTEAEALEIMNAETINLNDSIQAVRQAEEAPMEVPKASEPEVLQLEPAVEGSTTSEAQGLDSILQNMTIGKKKTNGVTEEDPFEFLGSVDDF